MSTRLTLSALALSCLFLSVCSPEEGLPDPARYPLIPAPRDLDTGRGEFQLNDETALAVLPPRSPELVSVVERWAGDLRRRTGLPLPLLAAGETPGRGVIRVNVAEEHEAEAVPTGAGLPGVERESYELEVSPRGVELAASGNAGAFYGLQTLEQLVTESEGEFPWSIPAVEIEDVPRFPYRGMHLDVGRHFFPVSFVKRYIDLLATYKMNVFHWHLTEDQGWRLEIEGYPLLTEIGSCRAETMVEKNFDPYVGDGEEYCGFYTREEAREVVAYARERFITVMPEIEMPGHSRAVLAAYPEFGCTDGPFEVSTRWGVERDILCPREETFDFLEGVLTEVMEIFPSRYIHIGGDEAPKRVWEESDFVQDLMQREGLEDEEEVQSWFIRRIERFLNSNGRKLMGWDEILEGGLAPDATVMSWRGMEGGIQAAREGHDVVMTPTGYAYLDYYQGDTIQEPLAIGGFTPLEQVYAFEPVPAELTLLESRHVLGAQGNLWTEYIRTPDHVEYMVLPRMQALSEVIWSPGARRDWSDFMGRLPRHLARLEEEGVNFRIPDVVGLEEDRLTLEDSAIVELAATVEGGTVRFTLDGTDPGPGSTAYLGPLVLPMDHGGVEVAARVYLDDGRSGAVRRAGFSRTQLVPPATPPRADRKRGLAVRLYPGLFRSVEALTGAPPSTEGEVPDEWVESVPRGVLPETVPLTPFGLVLEGFIRVPRKGIYTFFLSSDDGSRLSVGGRLVVDHDGPHGMSVRRGQIALHRGWHPLEIRYFQSGGGYGLKLEVEGPNTPRQEVPATWLAHEGSESLRSGGGQ